MAIRVLIPNLGDVSLVPTWPNVGAPSNGTSGTLAGFAEPGDLLVNTSSGTLYQNTNTQASPTWTLFEASGGAGSFTTLVATGAVSGAGFTNLFASPPAIGTTAPGAVVIAGATAGTNAAAGVVGELQVGVVQQNVSSPITITYGTSPSINCVNTFSTVVPQPVTLANSGGALPTGFSATTVYYTIPSLTTGTTLQLATSVANALAGTAITFSGGSGTQTLIPGCLTASGTLINVTGLPLTAGDWDVWGQVAYWDPATGTETVINAALSTTSGSLPGPGQVVNGSQTTVVNTSTTELGNTISDVPIPTCTVNVSAPTTVYLMTSVTEATANTTAYGFVAARRRR
jgi:hypothetical protein